MRRMSTRKSPDADVLAQAFGPLEVQVLDVVWRHRRPATVKSIQSSFPGCAYTTLMTTLDRLHKKGALERAKVGRAFAYVPRFARSEMELRLAAKSIESLLGGARERTELAPLLSCFVDAVSERDRLLLDDLERLLKEKRARLVRGDGR